MIHLTQKRCFYTNAHFVLLSERIRHDDVEGLCIYMMEGGWIFMPGNNKTWNHSILNQALYREETTMMEFFISLGVDINGHFPDGEAWTPLISTAYWRMPKQMKLLLENGVNVNYTTWNGDTALELCFSEGKLSRECCELLFQYGAKFPVVHPHKWMYRVKRLTTFKRRLDILGWNRLGFSFDILRYVCTYLPTY